MLGKEGLMYGKVYLVGAGPGDLKLITVKGLECVQEADVIAYDRLVNKELLKYAKPGAELIYCGKEPGRHHFIQEEIHALLVEKAKEGKVVTRLKGGDPFVFGRGAEEALILRQEQIPYEVVPGITAGIAAPAYAGISVTHREMASSFAIITGHGRDSKGQDTIQWEHIATGIDTLAFYMGVGNLRYISEQLIKHGRPATTPVAIIEKGTTAEQRTIVSTLECIADEAVEQNIKNPAMVLIGEVASLHETLAWVEEEQQYVSHSVY